MSFTDTLVTYGYGPIFTGILNNQNKISIALISYEDNFLRASIFPLDGYGKTVRSTEYKMKEDSRILLGPDILTYNNSNQNSNQILIPFTTNEILNLSLENDNVIILENEFNKVLLDLEIKGLISVAWITKDTKRIESVTIEKDDDAYEKQIKETEDKDYEASFPNSD